jgi:hypothetical protein
MIPKKIHYCWLSGEKIPHDIKKCIESWKKIMPEYELVLWDKNKFDIESIPFVSEAYRARKWAFAADYIRLYAIYTEGGIYLDSDVYVKKSFDNFLTDDFFTSVEYHKRIVEEGNVGELLNRDGTVKNNMMGGEVFTQGIGIQAAILGGVKWHPFLKSCLDWYNDKHFILSDGTYFNKILSPAIYANIAIKYGFRYINEMQKLNENMVIYPSTIFAGSMGEIEKDSYAIHCCNGGWQEKGFYQKIKEKLSRNDFLRKVLGKKTL